VADQRQSDDLEQRLQAMLTRRAATSRVPAGLTSTARRAAVRRRRLTVGAVALAAAAAVVALPQVGLRADSDPQPARQPTVVAWDSLATWWTDPTTLHYAGNEVPIGRLRAAVQSSHGVVYTTMQGEVHAVWEDGSTELLGTGARWLPMSSVGTSMVSWTARAGNTTMLIRYDMASRTSQTRQVDRDTVVTAVDEDTVFLLQVEQEVMLKWTGSSGLTPIPPIEEAEDEFAAVLAAQGERTLISDFGQTWLREGSALQDMPVAEVPSESAFNSDGRYLALVDSSEMDNGEVTSRVLVLDLDSDRTVQVEPLDGAVIGIRWDTGDTLVVTTASDGDLIVGEDDPTVTFACRPDTGSCTAIAGSDVRQYELPAIETDATAQLGLFIGS